MRLYYSEDYVGAGYAFDTTRKAKWIADSLTKQPIPGLKLHEPPPLTVEQLATVHDPGYIDAVRTGKPRDLAESQGFEWDERLWSTVLASNGGAVAAALGALENGVCGSLSSGLHHSRANRGAGFCTFNGLVLAARAALSAGAQSVLILDLDAHCGGGTASLIGGETRISQMDISVTGYDSYHNTDRMRLTVVRRAPEYLPAIRKCLSELDKAGAKFELCIYNAGMDPHEDCSTGGLAGITSGVLAQRERTVFDWCEKRHMPLAFVIAGGYVSHRLDEGVLVNLHRLTVEQAIATHSRLFKQGV